jgi:predicted nucleic acid-binding protein
MALVLDCSVTMAWLLPDEESKLSKRALSIVARDGALVPALWFYEIQNALLIAARRKRVDGAFVKAALQTLRKLDITASPVRGFGHEFAIAQPAGLTVYDAAYIAVALDHRAMLATLDDKLATAAATHGIALLAA